MSTSVTNRFADARLKIERADRHIRDLQVRIGRLENSCSSAIEPHPELGYEEIKYDVTDKIAAQEISLIIGDALHNLKCALDYGWIATLERHAPGAINRKTQFPIHETRDALKEALTDPKKEVSIPILSG